VIDITEILVHWYAGRSQYELADSLGVDRKTIRKYLAPAVAGPPRVFRTAELTLYHAASCRFRYSSWTSCGVR
jgi:hypothetical protein